MKARLLHVLTLLWLMSTLVLTVGRASGCPRPPGVWVKGYRLESRENRLLAENRARAAVMRRVELQRLQALAQVEEVRKQLGVNPAGLTPPFLASMVARANLKPSRIPSRISVSYAALLSPALVSLAGCLLLEIRIRRRLRTKKSGLCCRCDYDLRATPGRCPECGAVASVTPSA